MSLSDQLVLSNADSEIIGTFNIRERSLALTERIDTASTLAQPRVHQVKHKASGKGPSAVDNHLLSVVDTKMDAENATSTAIVNWTVNVPRNGEMFSLERIMDNMAMSVAALCVGGIGPDLDSAKVAAFLRGES